MGILTVERFHFKRRTFHVPNLWVKYYYIFTVRHFTPVVHRENEVRQAY